MKMPKNGVIIFNIDRAKLFETFKQPSEATATFMVLDENQNLMYGNNDFRDDFKQYSDWEDNMQENSYQKISLNGVNYMMSGVQSQKNQWSYIKIQDRDYYDRKTNFYISVAL